MWTRVGRAGAATGLRSSLSVKRAFHYEALVQQLARVRRRDARPLTFAEKILYAHLASPEQQVSWLQLCVYTFSYEVGEYLQQPSFTLRAWQAYMTKL